VKVVGVVDMNDDRRKAPQRKVDPEKFKELYERGVTMREICKEFGVSPSTYVYWRTKLKLKPRRSPPVRPVRKVDPERLKELYLEGAKVKDIAREFGVSESAILRWVDKLGLERGVRKASSDWKDRVLKLFEGRAFVTTDDVARELGVTRGTAARRLGELENEGLVRRFSLAMGKRGDEKYGTARLFGRLIGKLGVRSLLFYRDERRFVEELVKFTEAVSEDAMKALVRFLKLNRISDEGIRLFRELYAYKVSPGQSP
jgi:transposase-like protein